MVAYIIKVYLMGYTIQRYEFFFVCSFEKM